MSNQFDKYDFKQWCLDTDNEKYLDLWDYDKNIKLPEDVGFKSNKKFWFKCEHSLHESEEARLSEIVRSFERYKKDYIICHKCNSFGQHVIDMYGKNYLDTIWSEENTFSYYDVSFCSMKRILLKCLKDKTHPDYDLCVSTFWIAHSCPYCSGKRVCYTNSLGYLYPQSVKYWSNKNEKTPFDYTPGSKERVWFICPNGIHDDYKRSIVDQLKVEYRCKICSRKNVSGENHYRWSGGVSKENEKIRHSIEYNQWRKEVYKNGDNICQCCGSSLLLEAHHILSFATHVELRFDKDNGIPLCKFCHNVMEKGSFHNLYGTFDNTPEQLEEYINNKRKQLGINIPFSIEEYKNGNILKPEDIDDISLGTWIFDVYSPSELKSKYKKIKVA